MLSGAFDRICQEMNNTGRKPVMLNGYLPENASRAFNMLIWLICIIEFSSEFPVKLSKWICLMAYFLDQFGDGYWEIHLQSFARYESRWIGSNS